MLIYHSFDSIIIQHNAEAFNIIYLKYEDKYYWGSTVSFNHIHLL